MAGVLILMQDVVALYKDGQKFLAIHRGECCIYEPLDGSDFSNTPSFNGKEGGQKEYLICDGNNGKRIKVPRSHFSPHTYDIDEEPWIVESLDSESERVTLRAIELNYAEGLFQNLPLSKLASDLGMSVQDLQSRYRELILSDKHENWSLALPCT